MDYRKVAVGNTRRHTYPQQIRVRHCLPDNVRLYVVGFLRLVYRACKACVKVGRLRKARRRVGCTCVRSRQRVEAFAPLYSVYYR